MKLQMKSIYSISIIFLITFNYLFSQKVKFQENFDDFTVSSDITSKNNWKIDTKDATTNPLIQSIINHSQPFSCEIKPQDSSPYQEIDTNINYPVTVAEAWLYTSGTNINDAGMYLYNSVKGFQITEDGILASITFDYNRFGNNFILYKIYPDDYKYLANFQENTWYKFRITYGLRDSSIKFGVFVGESNIITKTEKFKNLPGFQFDALIFMNRAATQPEKSNLYIDDIYFYQDSTINDVKENNLSLLNLQISPNPSSDDISFSYSYLSCLSISICNSLGIEVKRFNENELLGKSSINLTTDEFPSGIYYCTLNSGTYKVTKSFIIIR